MARILIHFSILKQLQLCNGILALLQKNFPFKFLKWNNEVTQHEILVVQK